MQPWASNHRDQGGGWHLPAPPAWLPLAPCVQLLWLHKARTQSLWGKGLGLPRAPVDEATPCLLPETLPTGKLQPTVLKSLLSTNRGILLPNPLNDP